MTDRVKGLVIAFESDLREDDAEELTRLIAHLKGVLCVTQSMVNVDDFINRVRIENEWRDALFALAREGPK